jgi:signal transduction histidine kinase
VRERAAGILNVFFAPEQKVDHGTIEFLATMADQAALAIDYADLLERERHGARRAERQRLARDLHDSVVQQVFSIGMQTQALKVLAERGAGPQAESVAAIAAELEEITQSTLQDLRGLVYQLQPSPVADQGLGAALRTLAENTRRRTGIDVGLAIADDAEELRPHLLEDVYFIVAEAVHNAVKHSGAGSIRVAVDGGASVLEVSVRDDGSGGPPLPPDTAPGRSSGHGLASMRERAEQWGGRLSVDWETGAGTTVRARFPLPATSLDPANSLEEKR